MIALLLCQLYVVPLGNLNNLAGIRVVVALIVLLFELTSSGRLTGR